MRKELTELIFAARKVLELIDDGPDLSYGEPFPEVENLREKLKRFVAGSDGMEYEINEANIPG